MSASGEDVTGTEREAADLRRSPRGEFEQVGWVRLPIESSGVVVIRTESDEFVQNDHAYAPVYTGSQTGRAAPERCPTCGDRWCEQSGRTDRFQGGADQ